MEGGLAILKDCQTEKEIKVDSLPYVIGRCRNANFIIAHVNVSRNHCHIVCEKFLWKVNDYSSSGTYVNDELVGKGQSRILNAGDIIRFGPAESNLCWTFYVLNEFTNNSGLYEGLVDLNTSKDHMRDKVINSKVLHVKAKSEGDEPSKVCEEFSKRTELKMTTVLDSFPHNLNENTNNHECKGEASGKIETRLKKCQDNVFACTLNEGKCIVETERLFNKNEEVKFDFNFGLANICENQPVITEKKSSLQEDLQYNSFTLNEGERDDKNMLLEKLNIIERAPKILSKKCKKLNDTCVNNGPCFSESLLKKYTQKNIQVQKNLYSSKKARIETETNVKHETKQSTTQQTEELMKELEQLKNALNDLEHKNSALEGELAEASNFKNEALQLKSNLLENLTGLMEDELQCTICSELFVQAITLSCTHTFCKFCIGQWRKKQKTCPICRRKITSETRSLVVDNYIDKMVGNLSLELKERRETIISERNESVHKKKVKGQKPKISNFR